ncbi:MAG: serine/threonine-protein kinase [Archangium sp.]
MQRVAVDLASVSSATCVGCQAPSESGERCGHCGIAHRAGPYRVLKVISRSPHGAMYLAEDENGAKVALKELVFSLVPGAQELEAFEREAKLLQALDHPRIPKFLKSFTVGGGVNTRLYLAQQYVTGQSLTQRLEHEHFDEASVTALAKQALGVLAYLHDRSPLVVHRDVKPDNFILSADGVLSLVDFGAARVVRNAGTHRATLVGTFGYMAPEQLGGSVDERSDLYGLGATLIHLLTRQPPERLMNSGMELDFARHVNVSVQFERFLARLLARKPEDRFENAHQALAALNGASVGPRPKSRTNPFLVIGLIGATVMGVLGAAVVATRSQSTEVAMPVELPREEAVVAPQPPPKLAAPLPGLLGNPSRPPAGKRDFSWELAKWNFKSPGHWLLDGSGNGLHAAFPATGATPDFFGLKWDGTQDITVDDSPILGTKRPFIVRVGMQLGAENEKQSAVLISRGDVSGDFSWAAELLPQRRVRFTIADEKGQKSVVEGVLPEAQFPSVYFLFDPKNGEQKIMNDCVRLGQAFTNVRPRLTLPVGSKVHLAKGFKGVMQEIEVENGAIDITSSEARRGGCSFSIVRMNED